MNIIELFKKTVSEYADKTALVDFEGTRRTTYAELDHISGLVAGKLIKSGCKNGDFIAILMDRRMEYLAAYLGIMKAGCVVVPLIPEYPKERIDYITSNCSAKLTVTKEFFDDINDYAEYEAPADEKSPALLVYTSGSTGKPKGILHSVGDISRAALRHIVIINEMGKDIVFASTAQFSFIAHIFEYLTVFTRGGTTHILTDRIRKSAAEMAKYFTKHGITGSWILPGVFRIFTSLYKDDRLKLVVCGSERISNMYYDKITILNMYGMSEVAAIGTIFKIDRIYENTPIGKPISPLEVFVCDKDGNPLPDGESGEICIKGEFDTIYFKDPERTERIFIKNADGTTTFHTSDVGYVNENSDLVYVNRLDWMVKINGQRVETFEVESCLLNIDGINEAAVKAFEDEDKQTYLTAFYTADIKLDEKMLRGKLNEKMPPYMIPRFFVKLDAMPKNINGKLDRLALKPSNAALFKVEYTAPENDTEKILCDAFEETLHCGKVGTNDDFFALGGDSLKILKLIEMAKIPPLTPEKILSGKTPKKISVLCSEGLFKKIAHLDVIPAVSPLSEAQKGVYFECAEAPQSTMYNIPVLCRLPKGVDTARFKAAAETVISLHPAFNVTVGTPEGIPSMIYKKCDIEVAEKTVDSIEKEAAGFVRPFDLENGPLCRFEICKDKSSCAFIFDVHHIIFDGTSSEAFISQIASAYDGNGLTAEELTAFDISDYEKTLRETDEYRKAEEFFKQKFEGVECDSLIIPDVVDTAVHTGAGRIIMTSLDRFDARAVKNFTKSHKITEGTLFLGAFAYALAKFNGALEASFCTVNNGRHDPRLADSVGMFVKTLPIYCTVDEKMTVDEFLTNIGEDFYRTMSNDSISFSDLASKYGVNTGTVFIYQGDIFGGAETKDGKIRTEFLETGDAQSDLDVMIMKTDVGYELMSHFRNKLYTKELIRTFAAFYLNIVSEMLRCETLGDINLTDDSEIERLNDFNLTESPYDETKTVVDLFRDQVKNAPDRICLVFKDKKYTYREVDEITDTLARHLVKLGVGREKVVGILIPRCEHILLCSLGVLKAGGAYMPLDPTYPAERLNLMMQDSGAVMLICDPSLETVINSDFTGIRMSTADIFSIKDGGEKLSSPKPHDLFVMLYTSGSTGTPKGVMFEHSNTLATAQWYKRYYNMDENSHITQYASYGFDAHTADIYPALISGAELHIIPEEIRLDFFKLREYFNRNKITHTIMTTQVGRQFALLGGFETLRHISVGGEKLTALDVQNGFDFNNSYGPTEGSVITSNFKIDKLYKDVPIGKPVDNLKCYIADKRGCRLPAGAVGELYISGPHVTRGYLNRPEKTAEAYGENTFENVAGYERIYRTGDIVRIMCDGNLQFVGRRDAQVKIRGFRVELTEIEEVIRRFPKVKDATVAAFSEASGGKFVAAYVVSDEKISPDEICDFIRAEKPPYMVPAVIMQIDAIPFTQNQKVNKKALPVPKRTVGEITPPENATEQKIFDIISEVVGHNEFGINTDIYEAGLTSIGAIKLNVMLAEAFDVALSIADIKSHSNIKLLEEFINSASNMKTYDIQSDYPLTQTQMGIYIECSAAPHSVTYNIPIMLKLSEKVDTSRLSKAVETALNAHPYVKTVLFADGEGNIRARRNDSAVPTVNEIICGKAPSSDEIVKPFTLLNEPLYRISIYKTEDGNYLFMDFHHIIFDGTSENILISDIDRAYSGLSVKEEEYTGFEAALDEEAERASSHYDEAKAYYDSIFTGCEANCLPQKAPESSEAKTASKVWICKTDAESVKTYCAEKKLTQNAFFNTAFGFALSRFGQFDDVVFTTVYNGRSNSRLASSVTMLVKTLPVLVHTEGDRCVEDMIRETQTQLMGSMENDIYSFAEIASAYSIRSDIIFVYQGDSFNFDTLCGEPAEFVNIQPETAKAPITVTVYLKNGRFEITADYRLDMYRPAFIESFLEVFEMTLNGFTEQKNTSGIKLLSDSAKQKLEKINDTDRAFENIPVNRFVERNAEKNPDKTAVICNSRKLTYRELNSLANRIAHKLIERGVKKDCVVGMMLPRTEMLSVVELGILKSGGAFLGLLPEYPDDRVEYCLHDAESPIVITTGEIKATRPELLDGKPYTVLTVEELIADGNDENPNLDIPPESLAYCIYTSGSTGNPKGVMIEHRNLACCAQPTDFTYRLYHGKNSGNVGLAVSSISFDMSIFDNLLLLICGMTVCIAEEYDIHNPLSLAEIMTENNVDTMVATPSFLTNALCVDKFRNAMKNVKTLVSGAEAFPATLYTDLRKLSDGLHIINGYGPSECTITCCCKEIDESLNITIGGPTANTKFYVIDSFGNILPPYASGELIICGGLVGRGYIKLPSKTAEAFFTLNGIPAYHSGDIVRLNADGEVEFFGRKDNQVKLRGFRVELDEIEKCMRSYDGITQSKVIVRNNGAEDYLAGFFTADHTVDLEKLYAHMRSALTYYMVPDAIMQLESMPLTTSGKIDKKALPEIKRERKKSGRKAPKKSTEQELCELFGSVLSVDEFYADDNFFEMGGTSLSASKVTMQLMAKGLKVEYQDIFDNPTPEMLADYIEGLKRDTAGAEKDTTAGEGNSEYFEQLKYNSLEYAQEVTREPLGDVLLTGAVGFLGIHVLKELLDANEGKIICLVRKGIFPSSEVRLKSLMMYYFGSSFDEIIYGRVTVLDFDITEDGFESLLKGLHFDTVINCAACVKHYASDDVIERINVHGVENLIKISLDNNARLIQISTTSIPGVHTDESWKRQIKMHENELFVIDDMGNKYGISKYRAELKMLEAIKNGLRGKIIRVGNLMGRHSDGEFQINFNTNAFLNALRGFAAIGKCPISHTTDPMKFSPIDMTAKAVVLLSGTNDKFTAFHADSRFGFDEWQLIEAANRCGVSITPVTDEEYYSDYYSMLADEKHNSKLQGLMTNDRPDLHIVETDNIFTANIMYRLGFSWPLPDIAYLERVIESLSTMDYFDSDDE